MSQARTIRSASLIWISLAAALGLQGCMGSKDRIFPKETPTMKQIYDGHFKSMGASDMERARLEMHGREYWVVDEKSSAAKNKEGDIIRTQRVLAEPRPIASGDADLEGYTRTAENEISGRFPRLPNPTLVMYVYPHLGPGGAPIPGYSTTLPMYVGVEYAMPGESPSGARP